MINSFIVMIVWVTWRGIKSKTHSKRDINLWTSPDNSLDRNCIKQAWIWMVGNLIKALSCVGRQKRKDCVNFFILSMYFKRKQSDSESERGETIICKAQSKNENGIFCWTKDLSYLLVSLILYLSWVVLIFVVSHHTLLNVGEDLTSPNSERAIAET